MNGWGNLQLWTDERAPSMELKSTYFLYGFKDMRLWNERSYFFSNCVHKWTKFVRRMGSSKTFIKVAEWDYWQFHGQIGIGSTSSWRAKIVHVVAGKLWEWIGRQIGWKPRTPFLPIKDDREFQSILAFRERIVISIWQTGLNLDVIGQ